MKNWKFNIIYVFLYMIVIGLSYYYGEKYQINFLVEISKYMFYTICIVFGILFGIAFYNNVIKKD